MWTLKNWDSFGNYVSSANEEVAANSLTNTNGFTSDSGIEFSYRPDKTTRYVSSNPENQARVIREIMDAVVSSGGMGVIWWGADWIAPVQGLRSNAEMGALFDNTGMALPAIKVMGAIRGADAAKPGLVTGLAAAATGDTITLRWITVNNAIASGYHLERAQAAEGPWTPVADNLSSCPYGDMGLEEQATYYYRVRAYNTNGWGNYCEPLEAGTTAFIAEAPSGLRVSGSSANSVTLSWNAVTGAASYKLYGAKGASAPANDSGYTLLDGAIFGTAYTHGNLTGNDTWWYKASAVFVKRGEGPLSAALSAVVGNELNLKSSINMATAVLDADFLDTLKASGSTNCSTVMKTDGSNYQIAGIYAANDASYLYLALDYGKRPAMWQNDWITVWIDNANSTEGGAVTANGNYRIAANQTISPATIEFSLSHRQNAVTPSAVTKNTAWTNAGDNLYAPGADDFVIKYRIPLAGIGNAARNDVLKILVSNTQGWSKGTQPVVGCVVPMDAVTGAFADSDTVAVNMDGALSYTVK